LTIFLSFIDNPAPEGRHINSNQSIKESKSPVRGDMWKCCILHHGDRVLVVEPDDGKIDLKALKSALNSQLIDDILVVKQIPVDSRHNSKVDYPALMRMIENGGYSRC
jgi:hypothetical protein